MFTSFNLKFSLSTEAQTFYAVSSGDEKLLFTVISLTDDDGKRRTGMFTRTTSQLFS